MERSLLLALVAKALSEQEARQEAQKAEAADDNDEQAGTMTEAQQAQDDAEDDANLADLLQMAIQHEMAEGDMEQLRSLLTWASARGIQVPFTLSGDAVQKSERSIPSSVIVAKAFPIQKAWGLADGGAVIEGWVSTEDIDRDYDIVPPEAFQGSLPGYASRRMPLSSEHGMKSYPIGHGQRIALIRDGQVFDQAAHPTDPADFEHLPSTGSGVYGRFLITEPPAADAVIKGNIGGFSWVGRVSRYDRRPGGRGRIFRQVDPWMESTIAAYPVNSRAILLAATPR